MAVAQITLFRIWLFICDTECPFLQFNFYFFLQLCYAFQTNSKLYMVIDLCQGGTLYAITRHILSIAQVTLVQLRLLQPPVKREVGREPGAVYNRGMRARTGIHTQVFNHAYIDYTAVYFFSQQRVCSSRHKARERAPDFRWPLQDGVSPSLISHFCNCCARLWRLCYLARFQGSHFHLGWFRSFHLRRWSRCDKRAYWAAAGRERRWWRRADF